MEGFGGKPDSRGSPSLDAQITLPHAPFLSSSTISSPYGSVNASTHVLHPSRPRVSSAGRQRSLRSLPPRSGLERSDFCAMALRVVAGTEPARKVLGST